jgi:hypothetical protein
MIMLRRSKSNGLSRSMIAEIIFIETAPAYLHPFALIWDKKKFEILY